MLQVGVELEFIGPFDDHGFNFGLMLKSTDLRRGRSCVFLLHVHLVFVTKYRRSVFTKRVLADLREIFLEVCRDFEAVLVEFEGEKDHVHLLVNYPTNLSYGFICLIFNLLRHLFAFSPWQDARPDIACGSKVPKYARNNLNLMDK